MATQRLCSIPECGKPSRTRGWCNGHYLRWRKHGDPLGGRKTITPRGEPMRYYREVVLTYEGDECLIWPYSRRGQGYGQMKGKGTSIVSRLVCEEEHGPPPTPGHEAAHSCGKGHEACVTKRHLSWKTPAENAADKITHGTNQRGERCPTAKLTETEARQIRALRGQMTQREIGVMFGVSAEAVSSILSGKRWGWLD